MSDGSFTDGVSEKDDTIISYLPQLLTALYSGFQRQSEHEFFEVITSPEEAYLVLDSYDTVIQHTECNDIFPNLREKVNNFMLPHK